MYTVIKSLGRPSTLQTDELIGFLRTANFSFTLRSSGDGLVCELCDEESWLQHRASIVLFLSKYEEGVASRCTRLENVVIDVAIEPGDVGSHPFLSLNFDVELMQKLVKSGVCMEFSVYAGCADNKQA